MKVSSGLKIIVVVYVLLLAGSTLAYWPLHFNYFTPLNKGKMFTKIESWQARERNAHHFLELEKQTPTDVSSEGGEFETAVRSSDLRTKYYEFRRLRRRALVNELVEWIQAQALLHYIPDDKKNDQWASLSETFNSDGNDCDGLALLPYYHLLDLGFLSHELYLGIVYRPSDDQHHMVVFWFEDREDPWVIDPTGAMVSGLKHMSELPDWRPLLVFNRHEQYQVTGSFLKTQ